MKRLNRYAKHSPLNKKLRKFYTLKQYVNNCDFETTTKLKLFGLIESEINRCWVRHYRGDRGYEINVNMTNCRRNLPVPISCEKKFDQ